MGHFGGELFPLKVPHGEAIGELVVAPEIPGELVVQQGSQMLGCSLAGDVPNADHGEIGSLTSAGDDELATYVPKTVCHLAPSFRVCACRFVNGSVSVFRSWHPPCLLQGG